MKGGFRHPEAELHWNYHTDEQLASFPKAVSSGNVDYKLKLQKLVGTSQASAAVDPSDDEAENSKQVQGSSRRFREANAKVKAKAKSVKRKGAPNPEEDEEVGPASLEGLGLGAHEKDLALVVDELQTTPKVLCQPFGGSNIRWREIDAELRRSQDLSPLMLCAPEFCV